MEENNVAVQDHARERPTAVKDAPKRDATSAGFSNSTVIPYYDVRKGKWSHFDHVKQIPGSKILVWDMKRECLGIMTKDKARGKMNKPIKPQKEDC